MKMPRTSKLERQAKRLQERLLRQIALGARQCKELERRFGKNPPPELETLIKLHRVLILKFSQEAQAAPRLFSLVKDLMKPVMDWARLQEQRQQRELAEKKYRDQVEARTATAARGSKDGALRPETLEKIERELNLL